MICVINRKIDNESSIVSQLQQNPNIIIVRDDEHASQEYSSTMVRNQLSSSSSANDSKKKPSDDGSDDDNDDEQVHRQQQQQPQQKQQQTQLLDPMVLNYIEKHKLYRKSDKDGIEYAEKKKQVHEALSKINFQTSKYLTIDWKTQLSYAARKTSSSSSLAASSSVIPSADNSELGSGVSSSIYLMNYNSNDGSPSSTKLVAVKVYEINKTPTKTLKLMLNEIKAFERLGQHDNIIKYLGSGIDWDTIKAFTVLEYAQCGNIADFSAQQQLQKGYNYQAYTSTVIPKLCMDIARAMEHLCKCNIIHRDLYAANCLVSTLANDSDLPYTAKLCDFGLAQHVPDSNHLVTVRGRMKLYAPEATKDATVYTTQSDVYMFGMLMYQTCMNEEAYHSFATRAAIEFKLKGGLPTISDQAKQVCKGKFVELMLQCLAVEPEQRPSWSKIIQDLQAMLTPQ